ncbi:MAG: hypothetical protein ACIAQZ_03440 [Sedimentisphaeraceae bacterium JB056]
MKLYLTIMVIIMSASLNLCAGSWYYEDYSILIEPAEMPLSGKIYGYEDINLKLHNTSDKDHTVEIKLSSKKISSQLQSISKTVTLNAGEHSTVTFSKPYLAMHNIEVNIWIDRIPQKRFSLNSYNIDHDFVWSNPTSILLSENFSYDFFDKLLNADYKSTYKEKKLNIYRSEELPETMNAYSGFDSLLLKSEQLEKCSLKAQETLYNYIRSGGSLFVAGSFTPDIKAIKSDIGKDIHYYEYGLGVIIVSDKAGNNELEKLNWQHISERLWQNKLFIYRHINPGSNINDWFRVVEVSPVPSKAMVGVIAFLVIIIGPINILILRVLNKSVLMYITIPLISILGMAAILIFSVQNEGTENTEKTSSFTILDQREGIASTAAVLGYYCPILPIGELEFAKNTQVIPLNLPEYGSNGDKHINLDEGQKLYGSWINSRVPSHFAAIKLTENNKPVLEFVNNNNAIIKVTNKTNSTVSSLRYKDQVGRVWETENLKPGQKTILKPAKKIQSSMVLCPVRKMSSNDWLRSGSTIYKNPYENLYPGCYIANIEGELFLEKPAHEKASKRTQNSFIYGITGDFK